MTSNISRCQIVPLPHDQVSFQIAGREVTRWHFGTDAPRPFFFPLVGPGDTWLTRMGHPGAPNHDHHRSVWFAHHRVLGIDFWSDATPATIRQQKWLAYEDGEDEAVMAVECGWYDGHDPTPLMQQQLCAAVIPGQGQEWGLEFQLRLRPTAEQIELQKTNFGIVAVRVAKELSAAFGNGGLTDSEGRRGEASIFGQRARWVDYSGTARSPADGSARTVGVTLFDHPSNPDHPTHWHVRNDGWMGASLCFTRSRVIRTDVPLLLRYLLWIHDGAAPRDGIEDTFRAFAERPRFRIDRRPRPHHHFGIRRDATS